MLKFCSQCGQPNTLGIPPGDNRQRSICSACGTVHYENPRIIAGCVPEHDGRILLCRRAIDPRRGFWTVPAGFMENGETVQQAAAREALEEAEAQVNIGSLLAISTVIHTHQVHITYRATLADGRFGIGAESLEVELFAPEDIPWAEIAFESVNFALRRYLEDRASGREGLHYSTIDRHPPPPR